MVNNGQSFENIQAHLSKIPQLRKQIEDAGFGVLGKREREQQSEFAVPAPKKQRTTEFAANKEEKDETRLVHKALKSKKTGPMDEYFKPKRQKLDDDKSAGSESLLQDNMSESDEIGHQIN
jgi:hypothetical protein